MLSSVEEGLEDIRQGKIIIVIDDENRENEGDFIIAGEKITPEKVNFMITHGKGLLCVPIPKARCAELKLAPMATDNTSLLGTPFTMSVDLKDTDVQLEFLHLTELRLSMLLYAVILLQKNSHAQDTYSHYMVQQMEF